jgi:hypothetical protein
MDPNIMRDFAGVLCTTINSEFMDITYHLPVKPDPENKLYEFACD